MKSLKVLVLFLFLVVLSGCNNPFRSSSDVITESAGYGGAQYDMAMMQEAAPSNSYGGGAKMMADSVGTLSAASPYSPETDKKLIKNGSLGLHVESVRDSAVQIQTYAGTVGATVSDLNITRGTNSYSGYLTLRVPAEKFDEATAALKAMALYIESEYSSTNDVTESYMNLEQRLKGKQAEETRYLDILAKAENIPDVLSATQYLSNVQSEIEQIERQIQSYDNQVNYSTLSVSLYEDETVTTTSAAWSPKSTFHSAVSDWVVFLHGSVDFVIYLALFGWPIVLVLAVVWIFLRRRNSQKKKGSK